MSKKRLCLFVFLGTIFVTSLGIVLSRNNINFSGLLNASVAVKEDNTDVIESAKRMVLDNISKYNGEVSVTINDLISSSFTTHPRNIQEFYCSYCLGIFPRYN